MAVRSARPRHLQPIAATTGRVLVARWDPTASEGGTQCIGLHLAVPRVRPLVWGPTGWASLARVMGLVNLPKTAIRGHPDYACRRAPWGGSMTSQADAAVVAAVDAATVPRTQSQDPVPARFALELRPDQDPVARRRRGGRAACRLASPGHPAVGAGSAGAGSGPPGPSAGRGSAGRLLHRGLRAGRAVRPHHRRAGPADRLLPRAGPSATTRSPAEPSPASRPAAGWLRNRPWSPPLSGPSIGCRCRPPGRFSEQDGRPSRGQDVIVAQPDTGITAHVELVGVTFVPGFDVIDEDHDPTDPLDRERQPRARHRDGQRPGVTRQLRRHGLGPPGLADADPRDRERGADQADHGRTGDRLGDPGRGPGGDHEPGGHSRERVAPRHPSARSRRT